MQEMRERYLVDEEGKRIAVVLPIGEYERLLEELEDLADVRAFDEAMASGDEEIPLEQVIAEHDALP
jgi:hypothetical protein